MPDMCGHTPCFIPLLFDILILHVTVFLAYLYVKTPPNDFPNYFNILRQFQQLLSIVYGQLIPNYHPIMSTLFPTAPTETLPNPITTPPLGI